MGHRLLIVVFCLFFSQLDTALISCDLLRFATSGLSYPTYYGQCNECKPAIIDSGNAGSFYVNCTSNRVQLSNSPDCNVLNNTYSIAFITDSYSCDDCAYVKRLAVVSNPYKGVDSLLFNYTNNGCLTPQYSSYHFKRFNESFYSYHIASDCTDVSTLYYGQIICIPNNASAFVSSTSKSFYLNTTDKSNTYRLQIGIIWVTLATLFLCTNL